MLETGFQWLAFLPFEGGWDDRRTLLGLLIFLLGEAISIIFVLKTLTSKKTPAATLLWVVIILSSPYVGLLLYYLFPRRLHLRRLRRRISRVSTLDAGPKESADTAGDHPIGRFLCRLDDQSGSSGNRLELLASGEEFFRRLEAGIEAARSFVHLETYIFRPDATGQRLLSLLAKAAARGVEVRLLYDDIGSWALKDSHLTALHETGGKSVGYLPLLWRRRPFTVNLRNHRKLFVIDGDRAFVGGRNIADEYASDSFGKQARWFDAMLEVEGPGASSLHAVFAEDWWNAAEEDLSADRYFPLLSPAGPAWAGTVASGPDREINVLRSVLFEMVGQARRTLDISSPYLVPDPVILTALEVAATRGVRIRLHTNGSLAERFVLYHAARSHYQDLRGMGVEIVETRNDYNHAKMFIVDSELLYLGSANLDARSFRLNFELGMVIIDRGVCERASALFEARCRQGRRVDKRPRVGRFGAIVDGACRVLAPIL